MDTTNRLVKICRRLADIEYAFECNDSTEWEKESMREEVIELDEEYDRIVISHQIANDITSYDIDGELNGL